MKLREESGATRGEGISEKSLTGPSPARAATSGAITSRGIG